MTYELIDERTTNTLASYADEESAWCAWRSLRDVDRERASELVLVAFDQEGLALAAYPALEPPRR